MAEETTTNGVEENSSGRVRSLPRDDMLSQIAEATGLVPVQVDNGRSLGWHGNALLVQPEMVVERVTPLDLPGLEPRGALLAELSLDALPYRVVSVHLGLARRHRRRQIRHLLAEIDALPACPTVIMGDFNEWSEDKGLEDMPGHFQVHAPGPSFHAARPVAALDRIAHCDGFHLARAGVDRAQGEIHGSDHLPVWAELVHTGGPNSRKD